MDIQAEKIELVKLLLNEEDPDIISDVKAILNHTKDFYDDLPDHVKESIDRGLKDVAEGNVEPHEKVMAYFKDKYGIKS